MIYNTATCNRIARPDSSMIYNTAAYNSIDNLTYYDIMQYSNI